MALRGDLSKISDIKKKIKDFPIKLAETVAATAAPAMTSLTQGSFVAGENVYGDPRPAGVDGRALTLVKSGTVERELRFVSIGTTVRCKIGPKYARYLIGKYGILPNGAMPTAWRARLGEIVAAAKVPP